MTTWWIYVVLVAYAWVAAAIARRLVKDPQAPDGPSFLIAVVALLWGPVAVVAVPLGVVSWWKQRRARTKAARELRDAVVAKLSEGGRVSACKHGRMWFDCGECEEHDDE